MDMTIIQASMQRSEEEGYIGKVGFTVAGHKKPYEIALSSKNGRDWGYGLFFLNESGDEDEIEAVEDWLEEDDDAYFRLIEAAKSALPAPRE